MQRIVDHPHLHDQAWYYTASECGTVACFAGWACWLAGYQTVWDNETMPLASNVRKGPSAMAVSAFSVAQLLLGLTPAEAQTLFAPCNSRAVLQLMVKDLVNGEELNFDRYMDSKVELVDLTPDETDAR